MKVQIVGQTGPRAFHIAVTKLQEKVNVGGSLTLVIVAEQHGQYTHTEAPPRSRGAKATLRYHTDGTNTFPSLGNVGKSARQHNT